jgi:hypothetical protein
MKEEKDIFDFIEKRAIETPDDSYFESLTNQVLSEVKTPKAKVVSIYKRPIFWLTGVAAAVILGVLLFPQNQSNSNPLQPGFDTLTQGEVLAYIEYNIHEFDTELLAEYIPSDQLDATPIIQSVTYGMNAEKNTAAKSEKETELKNSLESISNEEILEYLNSESMGIEDLEETIF